MNDFNEFDKIIKDKMGGINEMPPSHLWANISAGIVPKAARIPFYQQAYFKISLLIASIVVILSISWYMPQNPTYNNISMNIEEFNINNINTTANNNDKIKVITSNNKESKSTIKNTVIKENTINDNKEKALLPSVNEVTNNNNQKLNKTNHTTKAITAYTTKQNIVSKTSLGQEKNIDKSAAVIKISNEKINNNTNEIISDAVISSPNEDVKDVITYDNNEEIIVKTKSTIDVVSNEETQELIPAVVEKTTVIVNESMEENVITKNSSESLLTESITETSEDGMPNSNFNPKSIVYDQYSIGAHYGYEQINIGDLQLASNNIDLSFSFQNVNFIAQTGIGVQISKDKNSYTQYYTRNEYLATQVRFDSIAFVDDGNGGITPVPIKPYYTDVYDSINHTFNDKTFETYYSLRIPLFIGYKKSLKHIDIFAKGGIIYSHIFKNYTGEMNNLDNESRMLESEYLINERNTNQLQYVATGGLSYGITKRLYLNAELMAKYYHYSLYKNTQSNTNTWSYEARFGITYLLN